MKHVGENEHLLTENTVLVDDKKDKTETIDNLIYQKPNGELLGIPLRLHIFNLARPNIDSILNDKYRNPENPRTGQKKLLSLKQYEALINSKKGFNTWLKKTGEAPVIFNDLKAEKTAAGLKKYFYSKGWFNVNTSYDVEKDSTQKASVTYKVVRGNPFYLDSITTSIASPVVDSLYRKKFKENSLIKQGQQFDELNYTKERNRLTAELRNSGLYHFGQDYIRFDIDTILPGDKVNTELIIENRAIRSEDSISRVPFKIYTVKDVNIYSDDRFENKGKPIVDSVHYNNYNLYSHEKLKYRPKALTDAIFIEKDQIFRDIDRTRTYKYLSELKAFNYPNITYIENEQDTTLTANIYLSPKKKYDLGFDFDVTQSNIQTVGFALSTGLIIRNVFRGAETLEISVLGAIGASKDAADGRDQFFDINEYGGNLRLSIPRLFVPFNTDNIIPKYMSPSTRISIGATSQRNIGLDKQTLTGAFNYNWYPSKKVTNNIDLFNVQFVKNLNTNNYFGVYQNSYDRLNQIAKNINYINSNNDLSIPNGANTFINDVLSNNTSLTPDDDSYEDINNISQRKDRLTEDNLIFSSSFNYIKDHRENLFDNDFSIFRFRVETAGNLLTNLSKTFNLNKNSNGKYEIFGVPFSQFIKTELDYVKHWDLGKKNVFAIRSYFGIAIPYGNSDNIPFAESFFAGGPNDIRAWSAYNLGPGSSLSTNEFNEANMKITLSAEQRFNLVGRFNGAIFVDAGNIWNVLDDVEDKEATFEGLNSLENIAVGSGFGIRYDFSFFILRLDVGFKTYDPSRQLGARWFKDYNFGHAVYNIGINYPF
ncbi:translocation and assembly module lipoprotein TamL [Psychroserpens ponticola]|uniref:BamA/TamA family outer membrane protein n=1 Tax=Psychroserpens ponticola TaxID=2932268 RepID=A0ABY7RVI0_9FLAO|nr:BamA/TamA family outer membrane protein [Psychroserpens ponticola]WCO01107.1 BamA/TamA family outer membrane protein [Psychroserpens ponticola]